MVKNKVLSADNKKEIVRQFNEGHMQGLIALYGVLFKLREDNEILEIIRQTINLNNALFIEAKKFTYEKETFYQNLVDAMLELYGITLEVQ